MKSKKTKSEISIKLDKNGTVTTYFNANLEDLLEMTNALIAQNNKAEIKTFMASISTILEGYKSVVLKK